MDEELTIVNNIITHFSKQSIKGNHVAGMQQTLADTISKGGTLKVRADKGVIFLSSREESKSWPY